MLEDLRLGCRLKGIQVRAERQMLQGPHLKDLKLFVAEYPETDRPLAKPTPALIGETR